MSLQQENGRFKFSDFLIQDAIIVDLQSKDKRGVMAELTQQLCRVCAIGKADPLVEILLEREALGSTGIGQGIAIPHGKSGEVKNLVATLGISRKGVEFDALDGEPVHIVFLLLAPPDSGGLHLKALAKISRLLKDKFFRQTLREAKSREEVLKAIQEEDEYT